MTNDTDSDERSTLLDRISAQENRAHPYDLWAELRAEPVSRQSGDRWAVTGYPEAKAIIDDPRISAKIPDDPGAPTFIALDPPEHDVMRAAIMKHFGPPHRPDFVQSLTERITDAAGRAFDQVADSAEMELVGALAYPVPVSVICTVLGVPVEDEPEFSRWTEELSRLAEPSSIAPTDADVIQKAQEQAQEYLQHLVHEKRQKPRDDLLSSLAIDGNLTDEEIIANAKILLIAGHETTVHSIANGVLQLLRQPKLLETLRAQPSMVSAAFEEMLRLDPPVQFRSRVAVTDIEVGGRMIPGGSEVVIGYAAANRDPRRFANPDRFIVERPDNQHLSFNSGVHYCFGAPLARLESRIALEMFLRRVHQPRLLQDPPEYRPSALLRGPACLRIGFNEITA